MKTAILRAPVLSMSGYGTHSRQIFKWLQTKDVEIKSQVVSWGITPWLINSDGLNGLVGEIMSTCSPLNCLPDFSFQVQLPNEWDPKLAKYNVGITAAVETTICNPQWIDACNAMDKVIVPSKFSKSCLQNSGKISTEIEVVPESFYDCLLNKKNEKKLNLKFSTDFNFLMFGQITGANPFIDRKNTFFTIKWLCEEFSKNKDVGIIIKTNNGRNSSRDRAITLNMMKSLIREVRTGPYPKFYLLHGNLEPEEIQSVYQNPKIKALVTATRGEGYGLPILEAAATGLPVLATNWSGHLDFMNKGKFVSFNYDLQDVDPGRVDGKIFIPGAKWANVKEKDFKTKVKKFYELPSKPKEWANSLAKTIKSQYSQEKINEYYSEALSEIL